VTRFVLEVLKHGRLHLVLRSRHFCGYVRTVRKRNMVRLLLYYHLILRIAEGRRESWNDCVFWGFLSQPCDVIRIVRFSICLCSIWGKKRRLMVSHHGSSFSSLCCERRLLRATLFQFAFFIL
jgi:hypothetical protein